MSDQLRQQERAFSFGPFTLLPERQTLVKGAEEVRVGGRAMDLLTALVERAGELVSKDELIARVWPSVTVSEGNLKANMAALRRALGDGQGAVTYILTVTGEGYRFVAPVLKGDGLSPCSPSSPVASILHNFPAATAHIIGRADSIESIKQELSGAQLVSIVGPGGIGKTTVAFAVAEQSLTAFKDGVWLVDFAPLKEPSHVPSSIATVFGLSVHSVNVLPALCRFLKDRETLLVLDNCEHMVDAIASCVKRILAEAADVKIMSTGRAPLRVASERVHRLEGLGLPPESSCLSAEHIISFPAIQLFVDRAIEAAESFTLTDPDAPIVAEICRRLDGNALAIELAAMRVSVFGASGLLRQLNDRFRLLASRRGGLERHRTLAATLEWSYALLSPQEAALLRAVSVFPGVFSLEGAASVSGRSATLAAKGIAELAAKSLLTIGLDNDERRYRLLETTRVYCLERLQYEGEEQSVRRRHAQYISEVLEKAATEWTYMPAREWGAAYKAFLDDLRAALAWAGGSQSERAILIRLTVAGNLLWNHFSFTEESSVHLSRAIEGLAEARLASTETEMSLQISYAGVLIFTRGMIPEVMHAIRRALEIAIHIGDVEYRLRCLRMMAVYELFNGQNDAAIRTLDTFLAIANKEDVSALIEGETHRACADLYVGELQAAHQRLESIIEQHWLDLEASRFVRFLYSKSVDVMNVLSHVQWLMGARDTATWTAVKVVEYARNTEHELSIANALAFACQVFFLNGQFAELKSYLAMFEEQVARHGIVIWRPIPLFYRGALVCAEDHTSGSGLSDLNKAIADLASINHQARMPFYLGILAEVLVKKGSLEAAEVTIDAALECGKRQNERWCAPELLRVKALILSAQDRQPEAEETLVHAMEYGAEIGAPSWRLRAAIDLATLWQSQSRALEARELLRSTYAEFTEGFSTGDLSVAASLLASM